MTRDDLEWWPKQLQQIFAAVGAAMGDKQLRPDMLESVRLPDPEFSMRHVSGQELGRKKGQYHVGCPGGSWVLSSGELQMLARAATRRPK